MAARESSKWQK